MNLQNYKLLNYFILDTKPVIYRVRGIQLATIYEENFNKNDIQLTLLKLTNPDIPGSIPYIAMELNTQFWIITDLTRWQQYRRYSPGPLADGTGGVLQPSGPVKLSELDLNFIKYLKDKLYNNIAFFPNLDSLLPLGTIIFSISESCKLHNFSKFVIFNI